MKKKHNVIYHNKDLDGFCSAMIVCKALTEKGTLVEDINLIGYDHADPAPPKIPMGHVYIVDIMLPENEMIMLRSYDAETSVIWIDHHKTSIDQSIGKWDWFDGIRQVGDSASLLTWRFFFGDKEPPDLVRWIDRFDVWKKGPDWNDVLCWQYGLRHNFTDPGLDRGEFYDWLTRLNRQALPSTYHNQGEFLLQYIQEQNKKEAGRAFELKFHGLNFIALNQGGVNSNVMDTVALPKHDGIMTFKFDGRVWVFSLYGNENAARDFDLSKIAKKMGGGGHAKACGFTATHIHTVTGYDEFHLFQGNHKMLTYHETTSIEDDLGELDPSKACKLSDGTCESCQ